MPFASSAIVITSSMTIHSSPMKSTSNKPHRYVIENSCKIAPMKLLNSFILVAGIVGISSVALSIGSSASAASMVVTPTPLTRPRTTSSPSPTPVAISVAAPIPATRPVQTLEELQSKIRQRLFDPIVRRGRVGVKIVSLNSGKVIFDQDSEKYFMPASNMKNFTVAAALEKLGADFRFVTSVYANSLPDTSGTIKGGLRVYGRGDISISTAFTNGDYYKGLDNLVDKIAAAGVKRIEGGIVGDESYFKGFYIPQSWEWDDLQSYYGAEVSALPINDNAVDVSISAGSNGGPCIVNISPSNTLFQIANLCTTTNSSAVRSVSIVKKLDRNVLEISGTMPSGSTALARSVSVSRPAELFVALLKQRLESRGIFVSGASRLLASNVKAEPGQIEIARLESPPLSLIAAKTMKPSQNMFTEILLWTLGEESGRTRDVSTQRIVVNDSSPDSSTAGMTVVKRFLKDIGAGDDGVIQYDGSGLSRHDLITPSAVVTLYTYMAKQSKYAQVWRDSLTIAGVDGTLANRMKGTPAEANFRGKTGTIDQVSALSGYMTTAAGDHLVVSILVNNVAGPTRNRTSLADDIVVALANFNGKID